MDARKTIEALKAKHPESAAELGELEQQLGRLKRATGLWKKERQNGTVMLMGNWPPFRVLVLPNEKKERAGQPDYYLMLGDLEDKKDGDGKKDGGL